MQIKDFSPLHVEVPHFLVHIVAGGESTEECVCNECCNLQLCKRDRALLPNFQILEWFRNCAGQMKRYGQDIAQSSFEECMVISVFQVLVQSLERANNVRIVNC